MLCAFRACLKILYTCEIHTNIAIVILNVIFIISHSFCLLIFVSYFHSCLLKIGFACQTNTVTGFTRFTKLISVLQMKHLVSLNWYRFFVDGSRCKFCLWMLGCVGCGGGGLIGLVVVLVVARAVD